MTARQAGTRRSAFRSWVGPSLICILGLAIEVYTLAYQSTTHVEAEGVHPVLLEEFGARVPITQTFAMGSNGLKAVRIRIAASTRCNITLDWLLSERRDPTTMVRLYGDRQELRNVSGENWVVIAFPTIAESAGRVYQLDVRAVDVQLADRGLSPRTASDAAALVASRDHTIAEGSLLVGGEERWGDLVLDPIAVSDTILGRFALTTAGPKGPLRRVLLPAAALAMYNVLLATFVIRFWSRRRTVPHESEDHASPPVAAGDGHRPAFRPLTVMVCLIAATVAVYASRRGTTVDLIDEFHTVELRSSMRMHVGFALVPEERVGDDVMRAIAAHPNSEMAWPVTIPPGAKLRTSIATLAAVWSLPEDGVVFRIGVSEDGRYTELFAHHLDPARVPADRRWVPVDLDLSRFSGRRIRLIFKTDESLPGSPPNGAYDWARWGEPRLVTE